MASKSLVNWPVVKLQVKDTEGKTEAGDSEETEEEEKEGKNHHPPLFSQVLSFSSSIFMKAFVFQTAPLYVADLLSLTLSCKAGYYPDFINEEKKTRELKCLAYPSTNR